MDAASVLSPGGAVAAALPGFRPRAEQQEMAAAVERALLEGRKLVVEAGTGVGKSFAYLVPVLMHLEGGGGPVVVATRTIALQEQLVEKDLPFLLEAMRPREVRVALAKGRGNYVCLRRLELAHQEGSGLFRAAEARQQANRIHAWGRRSADGSLADLPFRPLPEVWDAVKAEQGNCLHQRCRFFAACGYQRSRREIAGANLLVANHALVFADLLLREAGGKILPDYDALVLDEAHGIEEGAAEHFGLSVSQYAVTRQLARLVGTRKSGGLIGRVSGTETFKPLVAAVRDAAEELFAGLGRLRGRRQEVRLRQPGEFDDPLTKPLGQLLRALRRKHAEIQDLEVALEWKARMARLEEIQQAVELIHGLVDSELVYWVEGAGRRERTVLRGAPVDVAPILKRSLFQRTPCVVMTSATLRAGGTFEHFNRTVGIEEPLECALGSPFDYARNCRLLVYPGMPDPREPAYDAAVVERVRALVTESDGGAFVLFTSHRALEAAYEALREEFRDAGLQVMRQGAEAKPADILEAFRTRSDCVLFATDTFWQGVDIRGDNLRLVILTRLPFAVPDHPLQQARVERIEAEGGDSFRQLSLPQAVLKLRQGFGRLIRTHEDRGTVAILDPRIRTKPYGSLFLRSLPPCPVEER
ncbi:MAG: ATP-dependent DNA helicase [Planctomycetaceae bacterium]